MTYPGRQYQLICRDKDDQILWQTSWLDGPRHNHYWEPMRKKWIYFADDFHVDYHKTPPPLPIQVPLLKPDIPMTMETYKGKVCNDSTRESLLLLPFDMLRSSLLIYLDSLDRAMCKISCKTLNKLISELPLPVRYYRGRPYHKKPMAYHVLTKTVENNYPTLFLSLVERGGFTDDVPYKCRPPVTEFVTQMIDNDHFDLAARFLVAYTASNKPGKHSLNNVLAFTPWWLAIELVRNRNLRALHALFGENTHGIEATGRWNPLGRTAARIGAVDILRFLLDRKMANWSGVSMIAATYGQNEILRFRILTSKHPLSSLASRHAAAANRFETLRFLHSQGLLNSTVALRALPRKAKKGLREWLLALP